MQIGMRTRKENRLESFIKFTPFTVAIAVIYGVLQEKMTPLTIVAIGQILLLASTSLASVMFSAFRTLDDQPAVQLMARKAGRRFLTAVILIIPAVIVSAFNYLDFEVPRAITLINTFILIAFSGYSIAYIAKGLFGVLTMIAQMSNFEDHTGK